ncbi:MAG: LysM peptidoglycan-binding domain-containing protein [Chloroflexota bacterium]|nr:MAG: LysM peptidoglycan-binding domain-containing protein [Chloroflexota bacterium]
MRNRLASALAGRRGLAAAFSITLLTILLLGCQPAGRATPQPTLTRVPATPIRSLIQTLNPIASSTAAAATQEAPIATQPPPTATSPAPTPEPGPTATATPVAQPPFHTIEAGDSLLGIAEQFGVSLNALLIANGFGSADQLPLVVGNELQIPLCEAHQIVTGNTLAGIAQLCGLTLDDLVTANIVALAALPTLDSVPLGFVLAIPPTSSAPEDLDCNARPAREQVIEYQPGTGEGVFCLAQKFGVSTAAIVQSNVGRLTGGESYGQTSLLIPPIEGVLYVATADDLTSGAEVADLAEWYEVEIDAVTDWNGNPVGGPLREGQQLLISGANLNFGPFQSRPPQGEPSS